MSLRLDIVALEHELHYCAQSGEFFWKKKSLSAVIGQMAGTLHSHGYREIKVRNRLYKAHHLVWLFETGAWPQGELDHINGIRDDNRFSNLRIASHSENARNAKTRKDSRSGIKGVAFHKAARKWVARIHTDDGRLHLGCFKTSESAAKAYATASKQYHRDFGRTA